MRLMDCIGLWCAHTSTSRQHHRDAPQLLGRHDHSHQPHYQGHLWRLQYMRGIVRINHLARQGAEY